MEDNVIVFSVLKIKREVADRLPAGFGGWTNYEECNIFAECVEKIIMRKSGFSTYYLDNDDFKIDNEGKIRFAQSYDQISGGYLFCFGTEYITKIFYDEEFVTDFLKRILILYIEKQRLYVEKQREVLGKAQECLKNLDKPRKRSRVKKDC